MYPTPPLKSAQFQYQTAFRNTSQSEFYDLIYMYFERLIVVPETN